jgi:hypothetical protein
MNGRGSSIFSRVFTFLVGTRNSPSPFDPFLGILIKLGPTFPLELAETLNVIEKKLCGVVIIWFSEGWRPRSPNAVDDIYHGSTQADNVWLFAGDYGY